MTRAAFLCGFAAGFDSTSQFFVFPDIRDGIANGDTAAASWTLTIAGIVGAVALLQAGRLCDRFGHDRVLIGAAALFGLGSVLATLAPTIFLLVVARGFQAAGLASLGVSSISVIVRDTPPAMLASVLGSWGMWTAFSGVTGPSIASSLVEVLSWRWLYALEVVVAAAVVWAALPGWQRARPARKTSAVDVLGTFLVAVGLALVVLALLEGNDWGWASVRTVASLLGGLVLIALVVVRSSRHPDPVIPLEPFQNSGFVVAVLTQAIATLGFFGMWLSLLTYMTEVWDYSVIKSGLLLSLMPGGMAVLSVPVGRYCDRNGVRSVIIAGAAIVTTGWAVTALWVGEEPQVIRVLPAILTAWHRHGTILPPTSGAASRTLAEHQVGTGTAIMHTLNRIAGGLGPAVVVALLGTGVSGNPTTHRLTIWLVAVTSALAGLIALGLKPAQWGGNGASRFGRGFRHKRRKVRCGVETEPRVLGEVFAISEEIEWSGPASIR